MSYIFYGSEAGDIPEIKPEGPVNGKKSLASLFIYLTLRSESRPGQPISADELLRRLEEEQGIVLEKQAVVRAVKLLSDSDVHVFYQPRRGAWYDRHRLCA